MLYRKIEHAIYQHISGNSDNMFIEGNLTDDEILI